MKKLLSNAANVFKKNIALKFVLLGLILMVVQVLNIADIATINFTRSVGFFMIASVMVLGFYVLLGYAGLASLGTAGFVGLGTYVTGYFLKYMHFPTLAVLAIVILIGIVLGLVVGFISLRVEGMYLAIVTLGLSEILIVIFKNWMGFTEGVSGFQLYGTTPTLFFGLIKLSRENVFFLIAFVFVALLILTYNLTKSPVGRAMLAMKNSESAAQSMGVSLLKYRLLAFVIATVYAMIAGFLYMLYYKYSAPAIWNLNLSLNILAAVVIGGTQSIWGILLGTFVILSLNDVVFSQIPFFQQNPGVIIFINGLLMILVVMFYPGGISQLIFNIKAWIRQKTASRKLRKGGINHEKNAV